MKEKNKRTKPTKSLSYFWTYFKKYWVLITCGFTLLIAGEIAITSQPIFIRNIINSLSDHKAMSAITIILIFYFSARVIELLSSLLRDYFLAPVIMGVPRDFEKDVFRHLLRLPSSYHADARTGAAARAITRGAQAISFILDFSISSVLPPILQLIFVTSILLNLYSWQYGVITLFTVIFYTWFTIWSTEKRTVFREKGNAQDDLAGGLLVDSVTNIDTIKYFNNESLLFNRYSKIKEEWFKLLVRSNRLFALIFSLQGLILLIGLGLILTLAVKQTNAGLISIGDLVLVTTYIVQLAMPISMLGFVYGSFKNSFADLRSMEDILKKEITIIEPKNPIKIEKPRGAVVFNKVSFQYDNRKKVIDELDIKIKPGQKAAFVGPSGAGKSTIAKLIFRLYDIKSGQITIDGVDIKRISQEDRGKILAIVPQDPALFNDTIAANIRFGKLNASDIEVENAAKAAQIHDFILSLPQGYETLVGERGVKISGGERQRVAIARAIIKNPKILVFDEATSSLDSANEQAVLKTIDDVALGRTSISIAHRLSTIVNSDVIFVLKGGKVVEKGTHQELLKINGVYSHLWDIQTRHGSEENDNLDN